MSENRYPSILIVDDDSFFRQLLVEILQPYGFEIVEARSAKEGASAFANKKIGLAIVDYRLPDNDGMTFISQMRDAGNNNPIVFISGTFCDAKTFNWLRNILRVSLVLQKPIQAGLFLQQLEGLLPPRPKVTESLAPSTYQTEQQEFERLMRACAGLEEQEAQEGALALPPEPQPEVPKADWQSGAEAESEIRSQVQDMRKKLEVEARIRQVQGELRKEIPAEWEKFSSAIAKLQKDAHDGAVRSEVLSMAHKLKGTAGSLGLNSVSDCALKIENYLTMLDPTEPTEHELLWGEIFRSLVDGETALRYALQLDQVESKAKGINAGRVLVMASPGLIEEPLHNLDPSISIEVTRASSAILAMTEAAANQFDAAIIDLTICGKTSGLHLAKELRATARNGSLPFAFIVPDSQMLEPAELTYSGASAMIEAPIDKAKLESALQVLSGARSLQQPRILTVDDDKVLTGFVMTILGMEGMQVSALNEPIHILTAMEEVEPDLVLLDVMMPGLSGYDVCRVLRQSERWHSVPIVFLTSKSDAQGRTAAFQAGGNDFLSKPILSEELIARVRSQLDRARAQRQASVTDELTGLLKEDVFTRRLEAAVPLIQASDTNLTLCLCSIDYFNEFDRYGIFAGMEVVQTFGRLIKSRFKAESLRGRVSEQTIAIAIPDENPQHILDALYYLAKEVEQLSFTSELGKRFEFSITTAAATYPKDEVTVDSLINTAKARLMSNVRQKTGVTFT